MFNLNLKLQGVPVSKVSYDAKRDRDEIPPLFTRLYWQHVTQERPHPVIKHTQTTEPASRLQRGPAAPRHGASQPGRLGPGTGRLLDETRFASLSLGI